MESDQPGRLQGVARSMRVRILAAMVVLLLLASVASLVLSRRMLFDRLDQEVRADLALEAEEFRLLAAGLDPRTGKPFGTDVEAIFDVYFSREVPDEGESLLAFVDGGLYQSARAQDGGAVDDLGEAIDHWLSLDETEVGGVATAAGEARYVAIPLGGPTRRGLFVVANFPAFERREIDGALRAQATAQLVTFVLASLLGLALAGRVLRPLRSLAGTARAISDTDLTQRIPVRGHDEASQIARAFNEMLARLEQAFTTQRRFLDDAGHELRTPLTIIRGHVELLELDTDPEERRATAALITDEIDRMSRMVNDLLLLARAQQPHFLRAQPLDLHELLVDIHRKATALGPHDWRLQAPPRATITADRQLLTQAMVQLADNAARHTPADAPIVMGAAVEDGWIRLWVHDSGPGVPLRDVERIFDRFTRGPHGDPGTGAGLGLSIVSAIAEAHGGSARVAATPGPGARFEIVIAHRAPGSGVAGHPSPVGSSRRQRVSSRSG